MANPERPEENLKPVQETPAAKVEKIYTDPNELWREIGKIREEKGLAMNKDLAKESDTNSTHVGHVINDLMDGKWPSRLATKDALEKIATVLGIRYAAPAAVENSTVYKHRADAKPSNSPSGGPSAPRIHRTRL